MSYRPVLRSDLLRVAGEGASADTLVALVDPVIGRRVELGPIAQSMVVVLDGQRTVDEVVAEVQRLRPTRTRGEIEATLRSLLLLFCVEEAGVAVLERARAIRHGGVPLEPVFLEDTRVQCQGSGACCQVYAFGPITDEEVARIASLDVAGELPEIGPGPYVEAREATAGTTAGHYLKTVEGRCVFLLANRRCGVHAKFGSEAKPGFCRLYPLRALPTIVGNRIYDRGECQSFVASACDGRLLRDDMVRVGPLLPTNYLYHPVAFLDARTPCDYSYVLALADTLEGLVARATDLGAALRATSLVMDRWSAALAASPLEPGAADALSAAELARAEGALEEDAPVDPIDLAALARVAGALAESAAPGAQARSAEGPDRLGAALARAFVEAAAAVRSGAARLADPAGARSEEPADAIFAVAADAPWIDDALRRSLRQRLYGGLLLEESRLHGGLAVAALVLLLALTAGCSRARSRGRARMLPEDLSFGHAVAARGVREEKAIEVLLAFDGEGVRIARAVGALLGQCLCARG
jgi:Fe-S-cluster containining protein